MSHPVASLLLFGSPWLSVEGEAEAAPIPQKAFVLLAMLLLAYDGRGSRTALAARLYETADQAAANVNFRQLLARVRARQAALGVAMVTVGKTMIQAAEAAISSDLGRFLRQGPITDAEELSALCALYRGDLLEDVAASGESLDGWLAEQRAHLRDRFANLVLDGARSVGGPAAEQALEKLIAVDPYREEAWCELIRLRAARRGYGAAATLHAELVRRLKSELGVAPQPETEALMRSLAGGEAQTTKPAAPRVGVGDAAQPLREEPMDSPGVPRLSILMPHARPGDDLALLAGSLLEDVTIGLCRLRSFAVIAPHTAWQIGARDMFDAAERFGIDYLVETRLARIGDRCRLILKLIRSRDREIIWMDEHDFGVDDFEEDRRVVARAIVLSLADQLERAELARFEAHHDPKAYHLFLIGHREMRSLELPNIRRARKAFKAAIERSSAFAPAFSGIARTLINEWLVLARTERELLEEAKRVALKAIEADPFDARGYREIGSATLYLGGLDESLEAFNRAEMLAPHHADVLAEHADALTHNSDFNASFGRIMAAIDLNPIPPDKYLWYAGDTLFFLQRYDEALQYLQMMRHPDPAYRLRAACWAMLDEPRLAAKFVKRALEAQPDFRVDEWIATIPQRNSEDIVLYANALRKAGFP